ncbi:MAG TPA: peroxiredoxin [Thermomicrobiales bacterium]|jgi:peroxiredoxin (alkyl hydroperoxide reductase subunit C)
MAFFVGKPAPDVTAPAYVRGATDPQPLRLSDYRGKWLVLFFYPRDFTFVCPTEIQAFARLHGEFTAENAVVLGASTDSYYAHKAWYETDPRLTEVAYPILADTAQSVSEAFGVLLDDGAALRGTFIIDPEGIVRHAGINDLDVGRNVEETLRLLRALRTGDLCPAAWHPGTPTLTDVVAEPTAPVPVASAAIARVTDETIETVTAADRGVLILAKNDCGHCAAYQAEIKAALARGELADLAIGKLVLNEPGATDYKRGNRWLADVKDLPFTVLYRNGQIVDRFLGSRAAYLEERVRAAFGDEPELAAAA